jgi:hypothetical protein
MGGHGNFAFNLVRVVTLSVELCYIFFKFGVINSVNVYCTVDYSIHLSFVKNGPIKTQFYTFVTMVSKNWTEYSHSWKLYQ